MSDCPLLVNQHTAVTTRFNPSNYCHSVSKSRTFHCDTKANPKIKHQVNCSDNFTNVSKAA